MLFVFVLSTAAVFVHIVYLCLVCYYLTVKVSVFIHIIHLFTSYI